MTSATPPPKRPTGRRAGESTSKDAILDAALALFAAQGFESTSIRAIASAAQVDPALVRHFFGDKETLFVSAVAQRTEIPRRLMQALGSAGATPGRAITDAYLQVWEDSDTRPVLLALVRSAMTSERAVELLRETILVRALEQGSPLAVDETRFTLAGAHLFGVAIARHVVQVPALTRLSHAEIVEHVAPTIERYITGTNG